MTVKEVVIFAAAQLGCREEVENYITGKTATDGKEKTMLLVQCFNIVENELALDYLPLHAEEELLTGTGKINFSTLKNSVVRITGVTDSEGNALKFQLFPDYLSTSAGKVKISYTYTPKTKKISDSSDYNLYLSPRLMGYGVAAECAMIEGLVEDAAFLDKKYRRALESLYRSTTGKRINSRRWV